MALREDIWDAVHEMYRVVRKATPDTAWSTEQIDFTGQTRSLHRPASAAASTAGLEDSPAQLVTGDVLIADMEMEIKALEKKIEAKRRMHKRKMADEATKVWAAESKVREQEKLNALLRQVVMTEQLDPTRVDAINDKAVSISLDGPESRTVLLHESMALMTQEVGEIAGREFTRIIPPCPDPLMKPLSAAMPIRIWVLFVKDYNDIHHTYKYVDRQQARKVLMEVKQRDGRTLLNLRDQDVDDTKCTMDLMKTLVSTRHIGRLRQLGFHGEHGSLVIVRDDASVRPFDDIVSIEELLRHGDKKLPLMIAKTPPGVHIDASKYPENQMAKKAAKGPLRFQNSIMSAKYNTSIKSASSHTLRPAQSLMATRLLTNSRKSTPNSTSQTQTSTQAATKEKTDEYTQNTSWSVGLGGADSPLALSTQTSTLANGAGHTTLDQSASIAVSAMSTHMVEEAPTSAAGLQDLFEAGLNSWLATFQELLVCHTQVKSESTTNLSMRNEHNKRRSTVHRSVEKLLVGLPAEHLFHDAVDALDQKTRSDMLEEVANEFHVLGLLIRTLQSMSKLSENGLDLVGCCESFISHVKSLLNAQHVRLWMVDAKNGQIWEWLGNEKHPRKRSFYAPESETLDLANVTKRKVVQKTGIAADVARTGVRINVPFPAVQSDSFSIEMDRLPGENALTVLCEPLTHRGEVVAVVQCYNKKSNSSDISTLHGDLAHDPFTCVDESVICMLNEHMAELIYKCRKFQNTMLGCENTLHGTGLTWHYPCAPTDLFELAQNVLFYIQGLLQAEHCILYVLSINHINNEKKLWTACPHGRLSRRVVEVGKGLAGWVAETQESLNVSDISQDLRYDVTVDAAYTDPQVGVGVCVCVRVRVCVCRCKKTKASFFLAHATNLS